MKYPKVLTEVETVKLLKAGKSIARYGDGELKHCMGQKNVSQEYDPDLTKHIKGILKTTNLNCLVGIPRLIPIDIVAKEKREFWSRYTNPKYVSLYDIDKVYGSAFISRPDNIPEINTKVYFDLVKSIWDDRNVILINGDDSKCKFDKDESFMDNTKSLKRFLYPKHHAWRDYTKIIGECTREPKDTLFILALGPAATVIAHELCWKGYQALDLGHLGRFYAKFKEEACKPC